MSRRKKSKKAAFAARRRTERGVAAIKRQCKARATVVATTVRSIEIYRGDTVFRGGLGSMWITDVTPGR